MTITCYLLVCVLCDLLQKCLDKVGTMNMVDVDRVSLARDNGKATENPTPETHQDESDHVIGGGCRLYAGV